MENFVTASPSLEMKHVGSGSGVYTHQQNQEQEGFLFPFSHSNLDPRWLNPICVDAIACSLGRLSLGGMNDFCAFKTDPTPANEQLSANNSLLCVPNWSTLEDVKVRLVALAQPDQHLGKPEVIEMALWHVRDHLCDLLMDQHCNYLIQTIFQASNVEQITRILALLVRNDHKLKEVCMDSHGTRAVQKLLEYLRTPQQISTAIFAVKRITIRLSKSINGGYVILQCIKLFSPALTTLIIDELARNCVEIATDKSGCSIYQKCIHHARGVATRRLIEQIVPYALVLAEHPFGNYVVQYVVKMKIPYINAAITSQLFGKYAQLSTNKYASNVVENLLEFSEERYAAIIIQEIMYNRNFLGILQDPYGNYVVQRALNNCKGTLYKILSTSILFNYPHLHNHIYGRKVLAFVQRRKNCVRRDI